MDFWSLILGIAGVLIGFYQWIDSKNESKLLEELLKETREMRKELREIKDFLESQRKEKRKRATRFKGDCNLL